MGHGRTPVQSHPEDGVHHAKWLQTETRLRQMQDEWSVRETELHQEVEALRAAKRDSEARLAGFVDLSQLEAENSAVLTMQKELAHAQSQHAEVVQRLESRLQWCARRPLTLRVVVVRRD